MGQQGWCPRWVGLLFAAFDIIGPIRRAFMSKFADVLPRRAREAMTDGLLKQLVTSSRIITKLPEVSVNVLCGGNSVSDVNGQHT